MLFPLYDVNPVRRIPFVTWGIIAANAAVFLASLRLPELDRAKLWYTWGFVPARIAQLSNGRPIEADIRQEVKGPRGEPLVRIHRVVFQPEPGPILLSLVTCMFLHGGWFHLIGNMWFLWIFGDNVEDRLGHVVFLFFYLAGGIVASASHWAFASESTMPVIGASGAVAAVLGAYAITWPWARVKTLLFLFVLITIIELPALLVLGVWFLIQLMAATATENLEVVGGVAFWAHVGGFLAGLFTMSALSGLTGTRARTNRHQPPGGQAPILDLRDLDDYP